jgi:PAS domain S-box-containing protein
VSDVPKIDYKQLFEMLPERYILFKADDPDFTFVAASDSHLAMTMNKRENIIGKRFFDVFPDISKDFKKTGKSQIAELLRQVVKTGKPVRLEAFRYDIRDPKGTFVERYWEPVHYPIFGKDGKVEMILQVSRDVTSEVMAAQKARDSRVQLEQALSVGLIGVWSWNIKTDTVVADKNLAIMFGVSQQEAANGLPLKVFTNSIHPDDRPRVLEEIAAILKVGGSFESEYRTFGPKKSIRWVMVRGKVEMNNKGEASSFPGVIVDITERKLAEDAYRESEERFKLLAETMPGKVFIAGPAGETEYFNPQWEIFTGLSADEILKDGWKKFIHPDDIELTIKSWKESLSTGKPYEIEHRYRRADGEYRWHLTRASALRNHKGEVVRWVGTDTDISDQKQAESNMDFLANASKVLGSSLGYEETLQQVADLAVPDIADWCAVDMYDPKTKGLKLVAVAHRDPAKVKWARELRSENPVDMDAPTGTPNVIRTGKSEYYPHISDEMLVAAAKTKKELQLLRDIGFNSLVIAPIIVDGETMGAISFVMTEQKHSYTKTDREVIEELATRISLAISNALLYKSLQDELTERRATEQKLEESVNNFRDLADSMPQLIWVTRPDGYHEYYNQPWYDYTGASYDDSKGDGWDEVFHPDDRERAWKVWRHSLKTGEPYEIEYRLRNAKTGEYRWFVGRALPIRDKEGAIQKWYGTCTDINDQKRAADGLAFLSEATKILTSSLDYRENLKQVARLIVPHLADWCHIILLEGGRQDSLALLHRDPKKVALAQKFQRLRSAGRPTTLDRIRKTGKSELAPVISKDMIMRSGLSQEEKDIILRLGLYSSLTVPLRNGNDVIGIIVLVQGESRRVFTKKDLVMKTELADRASLAITNATLYAQTQDELIYRQELEAQLVEANEQLEARVRRRTEQLEATNDSLRRSNQELQDFAYVASHDLQEPLRKIQAFGNLLQEEYSSQLGEGDEYIKRIRNAAARMSALIEDLLLFSRVTTKARPFVRVDLNVMVSEVLGDLETRIDDTHATVTVKKLPVIMADPMQIRQLVQNLISNALKFSKPETSPEVTIRATSARRGGKIYAHTLYVEDNGIGFDEKYLDRIFAVFQRLHTRDNYQGTGIGLAICRKIVERHGGTITAQSAPDKGSTFIVTLPVRDKEARA